MDKGNTPRFTSRVPRDISRIKARYRRGGVHNAPRGRLNRKPEKQEMQDFNLLKFLLALKFLYSF